MPWKRWGSRKNRLPAFSRFFRTEEGYHLSDEEILRRVSQAVDFGATEISYWLRTADIKPHRVRGWLYSNDPNFREKRALTDRARASVVGAVMRSVYEGREKLGDAHSTTLIVLDELNKYAPKRGGGPIKEMLLDVAERGRSLGIIFIGAEQTASQVEERVVGNAALRVVGRLETAESEQLPYGWLSGTLKRRSTLLLPGTMMVAQPEVPVPLVLRFPFPA